MTLSLPNFLTRIDLIRYSLIAIVTQINRDHYYWICGTILRLRSKWPPHISYRMMVNRDCHDRNAKERELYQTLQREGAET